jgi:hypothetical protein
LEPAARRVSSFLEAVSGAAGGVLETILETG